MLSVRRSKLGTCMHYAGSHRWPTAAALKQWTGELGVQLGTLEELITAICSVSHPNAAIVIVWWLLANDCVEEVAKLFQGRDTVHFVVFCLFFTIYCLSTEESPQMTVMGCVLSCIGRRLLMPVEFHVLHHPANHDLVHGFDKTQPCLLMCACPRAR